jgi:hypothetical protein
MVAFPVYDLFLCALIIAKGIKSYRYGLETSLAATIIRHGIPDNATAPNLLTSKLGTPYCTILQSGRQKPRHWSYGRTQEASM